MFNLGTMYQFGIGLEQDFHLAKRFFDGALTESSGEAYWPATLALWFLRLHMYAEAQYAGLGEERVREALAAAAAALSSAEAALALALLALLGALLGRRRRARGPDR